MHIFKMLLLVATWIASASAHVSSSKDLLVRDFVEIFSLTAKPSHAAFDRLVPKLTNGPEQVAAGLAALTTVTRPYRPGDVRVRLMDFLIQSASDTAGWPATWRETWGPDMRDSLHLLLGLYTNRHSQMERLVDLFELLDLWSENQIGWLTEAYFSKLWPRLAAPWLRALEARGANAHAGILGASAGAAKAKLRTNFLIRAAIHRAKPPAAESDVALFLTSYPADAAEQDVVAPLRQGYRVLLKRASGGTEAAALYRAEVNALLEDVFLDLHVRYHQRSKNPVADAIKSLRETKLGAPGRKTPEQDEILTDLLSAFGQKDFSHLSALLDVGRDPRECSGEMTKSPAP